MMVMGLYNKCLNGLSGEKEICCKYSACMRIKSFKKSFVPKKIKLLLEMKDNNKETSSVNLMMGANFNTRQCVIKPLINILSLSNTLQTV